MVCVHTYSESDNAMASGRHLGFERTGNGAIRLPRKPQPRTKHEVDRMTRR